MKPDFSKIKLETFSSDKDSGKHESWLSPEKILIKPEFTAEDIKQSPLKDFTAGVAPFLRGP